jgi:hypothetical protein
MERMDRWDLFYDGGRFGILSPEGLLRAADPFMENACDVATNFEMTLPPIFISYP